MLDSLRLLMLCLAGVALSACERKAAPAPPPPPALMVFAAASTTEVVTEAAERFERRSGVRVLTSFAASSTLAQQIKAGSGADVFLSADTAWMDDLAKSGGIDGGTRTDILGNDLVLIAPKGHGFRATMTSGFDLAAVLPAGARIAVGDPAHVPVGRYARQSLESLGWWSAVKDRLVPMPDARAALRLVEMGEAEAGIVYSTDAAAGSTVEVVGTFPAESHDRIVYPVAVCTGGRAGNGTGAGAGAEFIEFLRSPEMAAVFERRGFRVLGAGP